MIAIETLESWAESVQEQTPAYVYDLNCFSQNLAQVSTELAGAKIFYALKANPLAQFLHAVIEAGIGVEVASKGEFDYAIQQGVDPADMAAAGPGKPEPLIRHYITSGIGYLHCESARELGVALQLKQATQARTRVAVRINPAKGATTTLENMTGGASRFGIDTELIESLGVPPRSIDGVHLYQASQLLDWRDVASSVDTARQEARLVARRHHITYLNYGGGLGVSYLPSTQDFDLAALGHWWRENRLRQGGVTEAFEVGRIMAATAGTLYLKVLEIKRSRGQQFAILDGGFNAFMRPALTGDEHSIIVLEPSAPQPCIATGPLCTPLDIVGRLNQTPKVGSLVAVTKAGAYGFTMGAPFFLGQATASEWVTVESGALKLQRRSVSPIEYLSMGLS